MSGGKRTYEPDWKKEPKEKEPKPGLKRSAIKRKEPKSERRMG